MFIGRSVHPLPGQAELKERLLALIDGFSNRRVLVVGDLIADEFIYGKVARVSREAPVLILKYDMTEMVAGGAGNAANNVAALGGRAWLAGIVGADAEGARLLASLHGGVDHRHVEHDRKYRTPVKTRILAGGVHSAKQQVVRIDREAGWPWPEAVSRAFVRKLTSALGDCDAVLLSDYGSGLVTPALAAAVRAKLSKRSRRRPVPVLLDSRYRLLDFKGLTACTPNQSEVEQALGIDIEDDADALERAGRTLLDRTAMNVVLVTRGSRGMALFQPRQYNDSRAHFRFRRNRGRDGRWRHCHRGVRSRPHSGRIILRSDPAGQLRRRSRRDEARHGYGIGARVERGGFARQGRAGRKLVSGWTSATSASAARSTFSDSSEIPGGQSRHQRGVGIA